MASATSALEQQHGLLKRSYFVARVIAQLSLTASSSASSRRAKVFATRRQRATVHLLCSAISVIGRKRQSAKRRQASVAIVVVAAAAAIVGYFTLLPVPSFPAPTGSYAIGTRAYHWTDESRPEPFTSDPNDVRELFVQVWYPAASGACRAAQVCETQRYLRNTELRDGLAAVFRVPGFLLHNIQRAPTHAVVNAPTAEGRFPILLNPTGFGGFGNASLFWIEELVSHGYVVATLDQPGTAAAAVLQDNRVVTLMDNDAFDAYMPLALAQAAEAGHDIASRLNGVDLAGGIVPFLAHDLEFTLTRLESLDDSDPVLSGHLDTDRAGVFGLSLGAYVGGELCRRDNRLDACLVADAGQTAAVQADGLRQPVMIMARSAASIRRERERAGGWPDHEIEFTIAAQRALFERSTAAAYYLQLNDLHHLNWTDAPILTPLVRWLGLAAPTDPHRAYAAINAYTVAFFDQHLKGTASPLLERGAAALPKVLMERRRVR